MRLRGMKKDLYEKYKKGYKKEKTDFLNNPDFFNNYEEIIDVPKLESRGSLTICPTPIGNLRDITVRQYQAIKTADVLACEDTRITGHLLELLENFNITNPKEIEFPPKNIDLFPEADDYTYGLAGDFISHTVEQIKKSKEEKKRGLMVSINSYNQEIRTPKLVKAMKSGLKVVLLSDAGTPLISDPGYSLVRESARLGIKINTLPGPTAVITALSGCGFDTSSFYYQGYLTKTKSEKITRLEKLKKGGTTSVIYESSHRIFDTLDCIKEVFGDNHIIYVGQELTKLYEKNYRGTVKKVYDELKDQEYIKGRVHGEITIVISEFISDFEEETVKINVKELIDTIQELLEGSPSKVAALVYDITGHSINKSKYYAIQGEDPAEGKKNEDEEAEETDEEPLWMQKKEKQ